MTEFEKFYGTRVTQSLLWDSLETYFREGGTKAYVSRVIGSSGATASVTLLDASAGNSLKVSAANPGLWGNSLSTAVVASTTSGEFHVVVTHSTLGEIDRSISLADQAAAINWSLQSDWIRLSLPSSPSTLDPAVVGATALTGGLDDYSGILDADRTAALSRFTSGFGTGQVSVPGSTSSTVRTALIAHARANNRQALLDATDTASRSSLVTEGNGLQGDEYGALFAPWVKIQGERAGFTRTVPPTAFVAGLIARSDGVSSPNVPAAGDNGRARYILDVTASYSDADHELLNLAGVNVIKATPQFITLYGYRTLAKPSVDPSWIQLNNQRLRQTIVSEVEQVAESFLFDQIDGKGQKIAEYAGALAGILNRHYVDGSLYGETARDAFFVDVGSSVNTPTTLADGQLKAVLSMRMSPMAELVTIEIVKVSIAQTL